MLCPISTKEHCEIGRIIVYVYGTGISFHVGGLYDDDHCVHIERNQTGRHRSTHEYFQVELICSLSDIE